MFSGGNELMRLALQFTNLELFLARKFVPKQELGNEEYSISFPERALQGQAGQVGRA
jgi:hypothetical protein